VIQNGDKKANGLTLAGRTCVFAGAAGGDGVAAVKALCAEGMNVVMATHSRERANALIREIRGMGLPGGISAVCGDKEPAEFDPAVYAEIAALYGSVDVIISNVGGGGKREGSGFAEIEETEAGELMESVSFFVNHSYSMLKASLPYLKASKAPRVLLMTSTEGVRGGVYECFANAVAKGAVLSLMRNLTPRLCEYGITVNCISKGIILREERGRENEAEKRESLPSIAMGRYGKPEDLAAAIVFFASEESGYITGQVLGVDGGAL